jgi:signal transduction histidine kinase
MFDPDPSSRPDEPPNLASAPIRPSLAARSAAAASATTSGEVAMTQIRSVIEALPEPILLTDEHDRVQVTNPSADALFVDRPVRDRADLHSRFEPADDQPHADEGVTLRLRHQPNRWFAIDSFPLGRHDPTHDRGTGFVYILRDVSDSHDLRPEREAFLSIISHELRTPITTIYAGSSVLARNGALSRPASHTLALDISAEAARLYDLVEDLIVVARLERRVLDPLDEPVLLQRVADATARIVAGRDPDIAFVRDGVKDPPPVRGDATYIEQAARDLVLSACRFGGADRPITLRLDHEEGSAEVAFRVIDQGPQLTLDEEERAFDLPDDAAVGRLTGSGVGPFVARHLVEAMGGRAWARNHPDGGVEMGFALPVASD